MEAIHNFVCEKEVCIEKVRAGLMHTMAELYELVGRSFLYNSNIRNFKKEG